MFQTTNDLLEGRESYEQGYYIGVVTRNDDPLGMGRVQANVPGLYETSLGEVPWIGAKKDSPFGFGKNYGVYGAPQVGSKIIVELQKGDQHKPLYSTLITAGDVNAQFKSPTVWGFQDPAGNLVLYNMATKTYTFVTAGGARIDIDGSGNRTTTVGNDTTNTKNWTVNVQGDATINATGNIGLHAGGTATYVASQHQFQGPVQTNSTVAAGGDITDNTNGGNTKTVADMRQVYDLHDHPYTDDGNPMTTGRPNQQI